MIDLSALHEQNHKITELSNVFVYLAHDRALCDTDTACRLFFDYGKRLQEHLEQVDQLVKKHLLAHGDPRTVNLARKLVADSALLRFNCREYMKRWTEAGKERFRIADHEAFVTETGELFALVLDRIQRETEYLYPLLRQVKGGGRRAA
jgi:hypothetical protein